MTLLEAISPTARQLLMMPVVGISKSERHKIHAVRADGQPLCGGGASRRNQPKLGRTTSARSTAPPA